MKFDPVEYTDSWGDKMRLWFYKSTYTDGNLFVGAMWDGDGYLEPYADITRNIIPMPDGTACLDTNNCLDLCTALLIKGDARLTGESVQSGLCTYPMAEFDSDFLASIPTYEQMVGGE